MKPLLSIENLTVQFRPGAENVPAVNDLSLTVHKGEMLALVGESGSGKSVTALSVLRLLPSPPATYTDGKILFHQNDTYLDLLKIRGKELQAVRGKRIGMIFQEPMSSLNPVMNCGHQVREVLLQHHKIARAEAKLKVINWFDRVQLPSPEKIYNRYPHQLSGGQKQRVMIAMAMCCEPSLLLCDEPTTALDVTVQSTILKLIKELQLQQNMGVLFITHDLGVVAQIADKVAIMYKGSLVEQGATETIFSQPQHPYTKALISCRPALYPRGKRLPVVADFMTPYQKEPTAKKEIQPPDPLPTEKEPVLVSVRHLTVQFGAKTSLFGKPQQYTTAVDDVSFDILKGETLGLVGESGCGKTTLGRTLLRLIEPASGKIVFNERDITQLDKNGLKEFRKDVQLVFQDPFSSLNPRLTIGAAIAEPMRVTGIEPDRHGRKERVSELLQKVDMPKGILDRYPHEFSGGQRQRIVIARALALQPSFLVCDESVSALDVSIQAQVLNLLNDLKKDLGLTLLFISHDLSVVRYMSDRMMVMKAGKIVESGPSDEIYLSPKTEYTKELVSAIPKLFVNPSG